MSFSRHFVAVKILGGYIVPTLTGNMLGGVTLVAILNHAQIVAGEKGPDL